MVHGRVGLLVRSFMAAPDLTIRSAGPPCSALNQQEPYQKD